MKQQTLTVQELQTVKAELTAMEQRIMHLSAPDPGDRKKFRRAVWRTNLRFLQNRVDAAKQYRKMIPPMIDLARLEEEAALTAGLCEVIALMTRVRSRFQDALLVIGGNAVATSAATRSYINMATRAAQPRRKGATRRSGRAAARHPRRPALDQPPALSMIPLESGKRVA